MNRWAQTAPTAKAFFLGAVAAVFITALIVCNFLRFPAGGDELHFWPSSLFMFSQGLSLIEQLRSYNELSTPLPFLIFGGLEYTFHAGIAAGRAINFASSLAIVLLVGLAGSFSFRSTLCIGGLLAFPYFLFVGTHLYTDAIAVLFTILGIVLLLRKWYWTVALCFIAGIACRQYIVAFPLALFAYSIVCRLRAHRMDVNAPLLSAAIAALSLAGWWFFFGGPAPKPALQTQQIVVGALYPEHGLYFLTCVGAYFVFAECILFRSCKPLLQPTGLSIAMAILITLLFFFSPPVQNIRIVPTMGALDITARHLLPTPARLAVFWALAVMACLRIRPASPPGLMLYANAVILSLAYVAWDKYALPMLATAWLFKSADFGELKRARTAVPHRQQQTDLAAYPINDEMIGNPSGVRRQRCGRPGRVGKTTARGCVGWTPLTGARPEARHWRLAAVCEWSDSTHGNHHRRNRRFCCLGGERVSLDRTPHGREDCRKRNDDGDPSSGLSTDTNDQAHPPHCMFAPVDESASYS